MDSESWISRLWPITIQNYQIYFLVLIAIASFFKLPPSFNLGSFGWLICGIFALFFVIQEVWYLLRLFRQSQVFISIPMLLITPIGNLVGIFSNSIALLSFQLFFWFLAIGEFVAVSCWKPKEGGLDAQKHQKSELLLYIFILTTSFMRTIRQLILQMI